MAAETPDDAKAVPQETKEADDLRATIADVYVAVRSREINTAINNFTFDHYIDEAKRRIKEPRALLSASGSGTDTRPSQLDALNTLKENFSKVYDKAKAMAEASDKENEATEKVS
jgi:hypothetical protein